MSFTIIFHTNQFHNEFHNRPGCEIRCETDWCENRTKNLENK
jgi:hypothetical protein